MTDTEIINWIQEFGAEVSFDPGEPDLWLVSVGIDACGKGNCLREAVEDARKNHRP